MYNITYITTENLPVDIDCLGVVTAIDNPNPIVDTGVDDELDCILDVVGNCGIVFVVGNFDIVLEDNNIFDTVDADFREDNTEVVILMVNGCSDVASVVTVGTGVVALREILNLMEGIIPLTALPRGVIKSRLTAVAVYVYDSERFRLLNDPSTISFLPTTGTVRLTDLPSPCLISDTLHPPINLLHELESVH